MPTLSIRTTKAKLWRIKRDRHDKDARFGSTVFPSIGISGVRFEDNDKVKTPVGRGILIGRFNTISKGITIGMGIGGGGWGISLVTVRRLLRTLTALGGA